jgi:hypothetical protein
VYGFGFFMLLKFVTSGELTEFENKRPWLLHLQMLLQIPFELTM